MSDAEGPSGSPEGIADTEGPVGVVDTDGLPRADGGVFTGAAIVAGLKFAYDLGKDFVPKLRGQRPIVLKMRDSSPDGEGGIDVDFELFNATPHTLYIERLLMVRPTSVRIWRRLALVGLGQPSVDALREAGSGLPWRIPEGGSVRFAISVDAESMPEDIGAYSYGSFSIVYSELDKEREETSPRILFRMRLPTVS